MTSQAPDRVDGTDASGPELPAVFSAGGEVGRDLARVDWASTPLGPPEDWPQSLRSVVRVLLSSRFSMWMAWGPELTFFCNEAYRRDTLGAKYPWALGRPASEVWAEIWPEIGPRIESVTGTGEATWDEALLLFLERSGYREETYHTFSYSPLTDDDGAIVGMLCVVSEDTERVIGARRLATVRDLGAHVTALRSEADVLEAASAQLSANPRELPFTMVYQLAEDSGSAVLAASTGLAAGHPAAPAVLGLDDTHAPWPLARVLDGEVVTLDDLADRFADLPTGAWDRPPSHALLLPFRQQGSAGAHGFLVAGLNPYRPVDADARGFVELLADQLGSALATARAYQQERERTERLVELDRAKTAFFTNVSHEFRTPLTLLLGPAEDALADSRHPLDPVQRERMEIVERNGERLLKLVNTLLDFSRLEAGSLHAEFEPVDLAAYTAELAATFTVAVQRVGLSLEVDCPPLGSPVLVDREMWAKIVLNLLSNALKFTFEGRISVRLRAEGDFVVLEVEDTGTGIPPERQAGLFERFNRVAGAASRSHEGSGIGLALIAELAAAHSGEVSLESEPGRGSTFAVRIPASRGDEAGGSDGTLGTATEAGTGAAERSARGFLAEALRWLDARDDSSAGGGATPGRDRPRTPDTESGTRPRVLVADDNADMRDYMARLLAPDHGVLVAEDGAAALGLARQAAPDLVLTDVMMPALDGFGLLAALRADPLTAQVPVVMVSARAGEEATVEGLEAGADDYLVKPFSGRELLARVRANLELDRVRRTRRALERSQELLDQAQRLAQVGSWEVELATLAVTASPEFARQVGFTREELARPGGAELVAARVHPDDSDHVRTVLEAATANGSPIDYEVRITGQDGEVRTYRTLGEVEHDETGAPTRIRGSNQDVSEQRAAERALADAAARSEAASREHSIADELQRSLLPAADVRADTLTVAAYYRAGVEGTQVGGDWYDVIDLGAGRTALVLGDVMGRGVRAAAVMGQLRSAVRAYARLDLPPGDVLAHLDGVVRDLGDDQIVTCVYAVHDPHDHALTWANAGHLPPLLRAADGTVARLDSPAGAPLGTATGAPPEHRILLEPGAVLALYTDGLVERRDSDIDAGIDSLAEALGATARELQAGTPRELVGRLLPQGPDDDVAVLLVQVDPSSELRAITVPVPDDLAAVGVARRAVRRSLREWDVDEDTEHVALLLVSELVTNGLVHGRSPVVLRVRRAPRSLVLEVSDGTSSAPTLMRPTPEDEHGRGVQLVARLAERWAIRPTPTGKAVWATLPLPVARAR
ncbi:SpoIIE family protein phosphatase [Motilibacter peucedani]|nr:SpoIIE family protein phosphatase [Motilibacter peucedani]